MLEYFRFVVTDDLTTDHRPQTNAAKFGLVGPWSAVHGRKMQVANRRHKLLKR